MPVVVRCCGGCAGGVAGHRGRLPPERLHLFDELQPEPLSQRDALAVGTLARDVLPSLDRRDVDRLLAGLGRAGLVRTADDELVKDGRRIGFVRAWVTAARR